MAGVVFDISQSPEVARWLNQGLDHAVKRAMVATAARLVNHIQTEVIPNAQPQPVDRGLYKASWKFGKTDDGAEVWNSASYAAIIEYGARAAKIKPGRLMIDALTAWVRRKGIAQNTVEARQIAFAIAFSMKKKGIFNGGKGLRILEKSLGRLHEFLSKEFAVEHKREFKT